MFPFPRLTPLQPGSDVHPCKRACLPEPPHLSGLPCWQTERNQVTDASQRTGIRQIASQWLSEDVCGIRDDCTLMMSCRGRIWVSLSEGNAKTCLEQIPVTESPRAYGPHKSTFTTPRKSVLSVQIRGKKRTHPLAYCPPGSRVVCADYLAHLLRRCTRLLKVLPSRQRSDMSRICPVRMGFRGLLHHLGKTVYFCLSSWRGW